MKERLISFSSEMVRAILDGRKTQTRRIIQPQPKVVHGSHSDGSITTERIFRSGDQRIHCPYGKQGDRLWVKETWRAYERKDGLDVIQYRAGGRFQPIENNENAANLWLSARGCHGDEWRSSRFMPRWASRINLEITDIRVQRVQEISEEDAIAEGIEIVRGPILRPGEAFSVLWDSINEKKGYGWGMNPYVWVIEFKRVI